VGVAAADAGTELSRHIECRNEGDDTMSNSDKIENKSEELKGGAKEKLGKATGDKRTENEGKADQVEGNLKQAGEKVKDAFK
jgi:uncharacterized protein YjbJ (UPF0337 family)